MRWIGRHARLIAAVLAVLTFLAWVYIGRQRGPVNTTALYMSIAALLAMLVLAWINRRYGEDDGDFVCPSCRRARLSIVAAIELPADCRSDETSLGVLRCSGCSFEGVAAWEASRRGALDSESVTHIGYRTPIAEPSELERLIGRCPQPSRRTCRCASHQRLGETREGRLARLEDLAGYSSFPLRLAPSPKSADLSVRRRPG
jgi:hypothetical protein